MLFWNAGLLQVVEVMRNANKLVNSAAIKQKLKIAASYQDIALGRLVEISKCLSRSSIGGHIWLSNSSDPDIRLIVEHANHNTTVLAITKAIECVIDSWVLSSEKLHPHQNDFTLPSFNLATMIRPLLACLVHLQRTVSGGILVGLAFQNLFSRYGDTLLDCWSYEVMNDC